MHTLYILFIPSSLMEPSSVHSYISGMELDVYKSTYYMHWNIEMH